MTAPPQDEGRCLPISLPAHCISSCPVHCCLTRCLGTKRTMIPCSKTYHSSHGLPPFLSFTHTEFSSFILHFLFAHIPSSWDTGPLPVLCRKLVLSLHTFRTPGTGSHFRFSAESLRCHPPSVCLGRVLCPKVCHHCFALQLN